MSEQAFSRRQREDAQALMTCVTRSADELRQHDLVPARVRMNPLDAELIVAAQFPEHMRQRLLRVCGLEVVLDEECRLGWPVAEFDP